MRLLSCIVLVLAISAGTAWAEDVPAPPPKGKLELKTPQEKTSYAIGLDIGRNIKKMGLDILPEIIARGIADALAGSKPLMTDEEAQAAVVAAQKDAQAKSIEKGKAFLEANKAKPGVKTLASGLQYKVIKSGTGKTPKATNSVKAAYKGTLIDGSVFDQSAEAPFEVGGVIKGWTEALQLMKVGDKWQLVIPADLAYGARGYPPVIPPNSVLVFEMELLSIDE